MKKYTFPLIVLLSCSSIASVSQVPVSPRIKYNFNAEWKMLVADDSTGPEAIGYNDSNWKDVTLPHAFNEDDAFKKSIHDLTTGIVWYRKHFKIDASQKDKKFFIEFEGIRHGGEFFLNGKSIGLSENGIMAFGFDVTGGIKFGEDNVIAARIDNSWKYHERATGSTYQWNDQNFYANYGGINKNVYLHITNKLYQTLPLYSNLKTTGVYVYADNFNITGNTATITAETQTRNEYNHPQAIQYSVIIEDVVTHTVIAAINGPTQTLAPGETTILRANSNIANLHFWSWGYGYLYNVYTILKDGNTVIDMVKTTTGFRKTAFGEGVLKLNDRVIQVKGYAQRTTNEWPAIGLSVPAWMSDYSNHLMTESNGNLVRWMHVTPWKQDVESCDRVGLMEAMPAGDAEGDVTGRRWEQRTEVMRDAIIYNRNNPSIIFYECGNKGISEQHMADMKRVRDEYDPHGGRAIGAREMLGSKTAEYGGEMLYINKSAGKPLWQMEYSRDEGLRKYWDEYSPPYHKNGDGPLLKGQPAPEYNRNQDSHAIEDVVRWYEYWHERPGTGSRVNGGGVNIIFSESNTHYRGAENYRRSGEVDAMRIKKDGFYAHQAMWNGWVDVEKPGIHIIGHWNYAAGVTKDVFVVSSADKVELLVNGKSLGSGIQSNRFLYTFKNVKWQPGVISAIGYNSKGDKICEAKHVTAGEPVAVKLTRIASPVALLANGADLALIEVEVVDAKGNRCPTALNMIHFSLQGPAEWRGGIAQGPDNFILSKDIPVECGVNRILLRSTTKAGDILIKANSDGLKEAVITVTSKPFITQNGLSLQLPADGLLPLLDRGPTPPEPSYIPSRKALPVAAAIAGSNADKILLSYDDNESTDWVSDGKITNSWIEYSLQAPAAISEVALKLNNFRTRSYPLIIFVDGKEVFKGNTSRSLGYFTAMFKPVTGSKVKIQLMEGSTAAQDAATEVNGKKLDDGVARDDKDAKGTLSIIEAEIYEQLNHPIKP